MLRQVETKTSSVRSRKTAITKIGTSRLMMDSVVIGLKTYCSKAIALGIAKRRRTMISNVYITAQSFSFESLMGMLHNFFLCNRQSAARRVLESSCFDQQLTRIYSYPQLCLHVNPDIQLVILLRMYINPGGRAVAIS